MTQLNLLPDVKLQYIKARHRKRLVVGISLIISAVFLAILISLFLFVRVAQKKHISDIDKDIAISSKNLSGKPDLDKILTIQNQLNSLNGLHDNKVIGSRTFEYLTKLVPPQITISSLTVDFQANTIAISGNADKLPTVNKFIDTLKFTDFETDPANENRPEKDNPKAFSNVVLQTFALGLESENSKKQSQLNFSITLSFNPIIFANLELNPLTGKAVQLIVPEKTTTRSELDKPKDLFQQNPSDEQKSIFNGGAQ